MNRDNMGLLAVITLVISSVSALLDEYAFCSALAGSAARGFVTMGFIFDLVFSVGFIYGTVEAVRRKKFPEFIRGYGLVLLLVSVPSLLLFSLPRMVMLVFLPGGDEGGSLYAAYRLFSLAGINGVLRVSRIMLITGVSEIFPSPMTARYTYRASVTSAAAAACASLVLSAASVAGFLKGVSSGFSGLLAMFVLLLVLSGLVSICAMYFNANVSVPISVMDRGFRRREFYLRAEIREDHREDEIWRLAAFYNESYLPAKLRRNISSSEPPAEKISDDALKGFIARNRPQE